MKMIMISYDSGFDSDVMECLKKVQTHRYTKWSKVLTKEKENHQHLDSHIWPGFNSIIIVAEEDKKAKDLLNTIRELKKEMKEEINAFVWPIEETI